MPSLAQRKHTKRRHEIIAETQDAQCNVLRDGQGQNLGEFANRERRKPGIFYLEIRVLAQEAHVWIGQRKQDQVGVQTVNDCLHTRFHFHSLKDLVLALAGFGSARDLNFGEARANGGREVAHVGRPWRNLVAVKERGRFRSRLAEAAIPLLHNLGVGHQTVHRDKDAVGRADVAQNHLDRLEDALDRASIVEVVVNEAVKVNAAKSDM